MPQATQSCQMIEDALKDKYRTDLSILFKTENGPKEVVIDYHNSRREGLEITVHLRTHVSMYDGEHIQVKSLAEGFSKVAQSMSAHTPLLETVTAATDMDDPALCKLIRKAWAEAFHLDDDKSGSPTNPAEVRAYREKLLRDHLLAQLQRGKDGVDLWNDSPQTEKYESKIDLSKMSFAGSNLDDFKLFSLPCLATSFDNASLKSTTFETCTMTKSTFRKAIIEESMFMSITGGSMDFTGAKITGSTFRGCALKKAKFNNCDLKGAYFKKSDLCGADFTDADMTGVRMDETKVDDKTKFPPSFTNFEGLIWKGDGKNPYADNSAVQAASGISSAQDLIPFLEETLDASKLSKALTMLKKDRFQLFSEHSDTGLSGIVASQTDAELLYSCSLDQDGNYSCCTQNLNVCGGLKGSLCKHLLVLIVGLVNAGVVGADKAAMWSAASALSKPSKLDKDLMTGLFLRYKGAEAGEVDWRPTETVPEDYYAF